MRAELEVIQGYRHEKIRIESGRAITIGRSRAADLQVVHTVVSRLHCRVHSDGSAWFLTDLESRNGTWVDGKRIQRRKLESGEVFTLGKTIAIRFALTEPTGQIEPVPVPVPAAATMATTSAGMCSFCMEPLEAGEVAKDAEGHVFHVGCRPIASLVGAELGGVRIIERLPGNGPSHRLRAHQPALNRHVQLHAFNEDMMAQGDFRDRLLEEVRAISRLLHPNLLQIHDMIDHRGLVLIVMEYLSSSTLEDVLAKKKFVNVSAALSIASQTADALAYAEEQGVVLERLSPARIHVTGDRQIKVDLFCPPGSGRPSVRDLAYVAPEVISSGALRRSSPRTDADHRSRGLAGSVYSLGAILYHMLSGIPPFEGPTEEAVLPKIMKDTPPALRRVNLKVSPALARIVERAMDKDPVNRPVDFRVFQADLKKIITPAL